MKKIKLSEMQTNVMLNILSVVVTLFFLFPLYWIVINSFKLDGEIFQNPPTFWPTKFTLDAYTSQIGAMIRPFVNSLLIASISMIISLLLALPAGYGLARYYIPGMKFFLFAFLVTQMLPASLVLTPLFLTFSNLKILNTYVGPVIATATISIPFTILLLRPNFLSIPKELEDSARIDGCNVITSFFYIMVPVAKPGIIMAASFSFVMAWNDLVYSITFNTKESLRPMTAGFTNL